jgi:hypothetical protein
MIEYRMLNNQDPSRDRWQQDAPQREAFRDALCRFELAVMNWPHSEKVDAARRELCRLAFPKEPSGFERMLKWVSP